MASTLIRALRRVERTVGSPVERLVQSDPAIDAMVRLTALQSAIQRRAEQRMRSYLHLWNLPALTDVRRLSQQLAQLDRRLREMTRELEAEPAERSDPPRAVRRG